LRNNLNNIKLVKVGRKKERNIYEDLIELGDSGD